MSAALKRWRRLVSIEMRRAWRCELGKPPSRRRDPRRVNAIALRSASKRWKRSG